MKIGDLVVFSNNKESGAHIVTNNKAHDPNNGRLLPGCIMIAILEEDAIIPMREDFLEVISES